MKFPFERMRDARRFKRRRASPRVRNIHMPPRPAQVDLAGTYSETRLTLLATGVGGFFIFFSSSFSSRRNEPQDRDRACRVQPPLRAQDSREEVVVGLPQLHQPASRGTRVEGDRETRSQKAIRHYRVSGTRAAAFCSTQRGIV